MTAIVFGLLTALMWASSNLCSSRSVRYIGQYSVVAWVMLVGLVITLPFTVAAGVPDSLDTQTLLMLTGIGVAVVTGLLLLYAAMKFGKVSLVAPIAATEGAVAAVISSVAGESLAPIAAGLLVAVAGGVTLSVIAPDPAPIPDERPVRAALLAAAAAGSFAVGLFLTGKVSTSLPLAWAVLPPRVVGTLALFLPLLALRRLRMTRRALPLVVATGTTEVLGYVAFTLGARDSIATVAVLASQVSTFTALGGRLLFKERLGAVQVAGILSVILGVTGLAIVSSA